MTVANRAISNVYVLGGKLNVVQPKNAPVSTSTRSARALREVQFDAQQREAPPLRALRRRHPKLDDLDNIAEAIRTRAPTFDVNAHLNYVFATGN